jgi:hypothetical protein
LYGVLCLAKNSEAPLQFAIQYKHTVNVKIKRWSKFISRASARRSEISSYHIVLVSLCDSMYSQQITKTLGNQANPAFGSIREQGASEFQICAKCRNVNRLKSKRCRTYTKATAKHATISSQYLPSDGLVSEGGSVEAQIVSLQQQQNEAQVTPQAHFLLSAICHQKMSLEVEVWAGADLLVPWGVHRTPVREFFLCKTAVFHHLCTM